MQTKPLQHLTHVVPALHPTDRQSLAGGFVAHRELSAHVASFAMAQQARQSSRVVFFMHVSDSGPSGAPPSSAPASPASRTAGESVGATSRRVSTRPAGPSDGD